MIDTATENLKRDLFEWWDSLGPNDEVIAGKLIGLIRIHQAAAWEEGLNAGIGYAGVMRSGFPEPTNRYDGSLSTSTQ